MQCTKPLCESIVITDYFLHRFVPAQPPNIALIGNILGSSFSTAVVGYAVAVSVAKVYAAKHDYTVDGNQVYKNSV